MKYTEVVKELIERDYSAKEVGQVLDEMVGLEQQIDYADWLWNMRGQPEEDYGDTE